MKKQSAKNVREMLNISQYEMAKKTGWSRTKVQLVEQSVVILSEKDEDKYFLVLKKAKEKLFKDLAWL